MYFVEKKFHGCHLPRIFRPAHPHDELAKNATLDIALNIQGFQCQVYFTTQYPIFLHDHNGDG